VQKYLEEKIMVSKGLFVRLEARPGKERDIEMLLKSGLSVADAEPGTIAWFGVRLGPSTFGIFDAFHNDLGMHAHLDGRIAAALRDHAEDLFAAPPTIEKMDVLAAKLP
jgi:quinol monooxygenase YgiN